MGRCISCTVAKRTLEYRRFLQKHTGETAKKKRLNMSPGWQGYNNMQHQCHRADFLRNNPLVCSSHSDQSIQHCIEHGFPECCELLSSSTQIPTTTNEDVSIPDDSNHQGTYGLGFLENYISETWNTWSSKHRTPTGTVREEDTQTKGKIMV